MNPTAAPQRVPAQPTAAGNPGWEIARFAELPGTPCPCGTSRRAFLEVPDFPGSIHQVEISLEARLHYHRRLTETYYFLECEPGAQLQLDDQVIPVEPGMCVLIRPGVRHRALGRMKVLNIVFPKFDPTDEWFDEPGSEPTPGRHS